MRGACVVLLTYQRYDAHPTRSSQEVSNLSDPRPGSALTVTTSDSDSGLIYRAMGEWIMRGLSPRVQTEMCAP